MAISRCGCFDHDVDVNKVYSCEYPIKSYEGAVLALYERNGYDDSDFYALVWDEESQSIKRVEYATTRCWTYHNSASIDATQEAISKAQAVLADSLFKLKVSNATQRSTDPTVGKVVKSLTKRGKNVGVVGTIVRREANPYRTYYRNGYTNPNAFHNQRVALKVEGETKWRWLDADRVAVVDPEPINEAELKREADSEAAYRAANGLWRLS